MKNILLITNLLIFIFFIGCGGAESKTRDKEYIDSDEKSSNIPTGFKGYKLFDYLVAKDNIDVKVYRYKNNNFLEEEKLEYENSNLIIKERSLLYLGGQIEYQNPKNSQNLRDTIDVILYENNSQKHFKLKNFIDIGSVVTIRDSECKFTKHFELFKFDNKEFKDVIEISCPNSIGYYQKNRGLVIENLIEEVDSNNYDFTPQYPNREIIPVDKTLSHMSVLNLDSAKEANVDRLWRYPYYLNGEDMKIGLVDGGNVLESHVELKGRVHNLFEGDTNIHATHVAGTLISKGEWLLDSRGFAKNANIYVVNYSKLYFSNAVKKLLEYNVLISNHSYGFEGPEGIGEYDGESRDFDKLISQNPYIIAVIAAGNDGKRYKDDSDYTKWNLIKGGANAKNVITVAAVDDGSDKIAEFSSRGPINGGRLKPDISLDGYNVLSTSDYDDTAYKRMYGTSMAAPGVTGAVTLLSQRYKEINGANPRVDTIKAILFNSAKDIENPGPDFKSGFGVLDALQAVKYIDTMDSNDSLIKLDSIRKNEHQKYFINSKIYQKLKITIAWVDGIYSNCNNCANDVLMSDIDMYLENTNSGKIVYPYTLDEFNPDKNAIQTRQNHKDPQEQIEANLTPGNYILHIVGTKIDKDRQNFTLVSNITLSNVEKNINIQPMNEHIHKIYKSIIK